jgi:hypothetical protein
MKKAIRELLNDQILSPNTRRFRAVLKQELVDYRSRRREAKTLKRTEVKSHVRPAKVKAIEIKPPLKNNRRVIVDGKLICLVCGPQPVAQFSTVVRKGRKYFDSRCDSCRKIACIARNHNISPSKYRELLALSGGKCSICGTSSKRLCLDHCHTSGRLRGFVCNRCNMAIAPFDGNVDLGEGVLRYLRYWSEQPMSEADLVTGAERERRMKKIRQGATRRKKAA